MALSAASKIHKQGNVPPTTLEEDISSYLFQLQTNAQNEELAQTLKALYFVSAKELDVGDGERAVVIFVPVPQLAQFKSVWKNIVNELEKRLSKNVVLVANRTILNRITQLNKRKRQKRPVSRTLTSVHNALLDDIVFPAEPIDKRMRVRIDGSKLYKVYGCFGLC